MIHLPNWVGTEWLKQLMAEQMVTVRKRRAFGDQKWQKIRERNEDLGCRVYAREAAWILGADRWGDATWKWLEDQAGVRTREPVAIAPAEETKPAAPNAGTVLTPRRHRTGAVLLTLPPGFNPV